MSIPKRLKSFEYAFKGIATLVREEPNARIHFLAMVVVIVAGIYFGLTTTEWALIGLTIAAVFAAEAFNSSLEALTDLASPELHPLAGKAKDLAAAGVLLVALGAVIVAIFIFGPHLWALIR